jgi:hypothetical protein
MAVQSLPPLPLSKHHLSIFVAMLPEILPKVAAVTAYNRQIVNQAPRARANTVKFHQEGTKSGKKARTVNLDDGFSREDLTYRWCRPSVVAGYRNQPVVIQLSRFSDKSKSLGTLQMPHLHLKSQPCHRSRIRTSAIVGRH